MGYVVFNFSYYVSILFPKAFKNKKTKTKSQQTLGNLSNWAPFFVALIKRTLKKGCIGLRLGIH